MDRKEELNSKIKRLERERKILYNASVQKWQTKKEKRRLWNSIMHIDMDIFLLKAIIKTL